MSNQKSKIMDSYPFLDQASAKEPFIFDVLNEITSIQKDFEKGRATSFATRAQIYKSNNIKMPFTPSRDKNLSFLLELLSSRYPEYISSIITFHLSYDEAAKKLNIIEEEEFCFSLAHEEIDRLQGLRDKKSIESIKALIAKYRVFNLTKLSRMVHRKKLFAKILQKTIDKDIFVFKKVEIVQNKFSPVQEFCFHAKNYNHVKTSLKIEVLKNIIANYRDMINPRLSHYGIPNADISDYTDNKIDYILHILLGDLKSSLTPKDTVTVQNFKSLRECILRVDKALDPTVIYANEIVKHIRQHKFVAPSDITASILSLDEATVKAWAKAEVLAKEHIIDYRASNNITYFIYAPAISSEFYSLYNFARYEAEKYKQLPSGQKDLIKMKLDAFRECSERVLAAPNPTETLQCEADEVDGLKELITEYEAWLKQKELRSELSEKQNGKSKNGNIFAAIFQIILSLFSFGAGSDSDDDEGQDEAAPSHSTHSSSSSPHESGVSRTKRPVIKETKQVYAKIKSRNAPLLGLSEFIELNKENDHKIDQIIKDFRDRNLKIIMPVYNARKGLYPKRSSKLLISDIEYLLIEPDVVASSEAITKYIDSLVGYKLREDVIPGNTLLTIEKYLRNIHRQQRARLRARKGK